MSGGSTIFLYGASGAGKSVVGKTLAAQLDLPFVDLDVEIERAGGQPIAQMMTEHGERFFRDLETATLKSVCSDSEQVIALGGGALLRAENRVLADSIGEVVLLDADPATLSMRLRADKSKRPLLAGDLDAKLSALLTDREPHYASFPLRVDASAPPEQVSDEIQRLLGHYHLRGMGADYDVLVREGGLVQLADLIAARGLNAPLLLVSDSNVAPLYVRTVADALGAAGWQVAGHVVPAGEARKTLETVSGIWQACLQFGLDRHSTIISLGGGVVSDLAGFAAATYMRGCNWVALPTTLLAMVDASLGGKTGFDLPEGKNLIGAFHPPALVLADPQTLATLPERELRAGLAEVVKHGVIADPDLFALCARGWDYVRAHLPEIVRRGMAVKARIIEADPYEQNIRAALNFGHTIGHAVELVSGFSLLHGEAVSIGMVAEARLGERLTVAGSGTSETLTAVLSGLGLPIEIPSDLPREALIRAMKMDKKKSAGMIRFSLPESIGCVRVGVTVENLEDSL
ncbi:MAG: 3-dehydroquinate synthase [Anaerolineales bacterium]|nr:3-dehydroquinate synthase [Anaerolineales bacterium]